MLGAIFIASSNLTSNGKIATIRVYHTGKKLPYGYLVHLQLLLYFFLSTDIV